MAKKTASAEKSDGEDAAKGGGKLKLILMIVPTVLLIVGAIYFLFLKPSATPTAAAGGSAAQPSPSSTFAPGNVVAVDAITINLANGHYLKLGMGLQETADVSTDVLPEQAEDSAISEYSGMTVDQLSTAAERDKTKADLVAAVMKQYDKKVYDIYFTTFVMQ
jgi:flagellar protein FliL